MPFENIAETNLSYGLIAFDAAGNERNDDPDGKMSEALIERAIKDHITDIFFFCHGWMGDVVAATTQYNCWIRAFGSAMRLQDKSATCEAIEPMYIGVHWPSLPWGDEELTASGAFACQVNPSGRYDLLEACLARLGKGVAIRTALETIFQEAKRNAAPERLPANVRQAYLDLNNALGLSSAGVSAAPDADRAPFDPDESYDAANEESANFGGGLNFGGILGPLRQLSYWTMKKRARTVGEGGMSDFLDDMQSATTNNHARIHLMGHSFGTVVVSSMVSDDDSLGTARRPVDSMALVQGAVSLWSFAASIPFRNAGPGYFNHLLVNKAIRGPIVATSSRWDKAVGVFYPLASRMKGSPSFQPTLPEYGAIGAFGIQGLPDSIRSEIKMKPAGAVYDFEEGKVYNLDASEYICKGSGASGAHSDIAGPEVAHAIWAAVLSGIQ